MRKSPAELLISVVLPVQSSHVPDLEKVDGHGGVAVELGVRDAGSRARHLQIASLEHLEPPQRVLVLQLACNDVREDLKLAMAVRTKALRLEINQSDLATGLTNLRNGPNRCYAVLVDHAERAVLVKALLLVGGERESVVRFEPAVVGVATRGAASGDELEGRGG